MNISTFQKAAIVISIIITAISFMIIQLNNFAQDSSLNSWNEGVPGYIASIREQKTSSKPIALFFYTDWCPNCKKLREEILSTPEVQAFMAELLPVKINPEKGPLENQLSEEYGVFGYPTVIIVPGAGKQPTVIRRTSNITPAQFIEQCRQALAA
ncbi:MAG: thioredoxin family protein [Gammaproteobacteria bacterium]|nr:thioredoxin family protein [Gammaproteobacteria bacterium]